MYTLNHFIWLAVCALVIAISIILLRKYKPSLKTVLTIACIVSVISEIIKTFSLMQLVPSTDGTRFYPYIELENVPFHLCSIQIVLIFMTRFMKESNARTTILAFMYPTTIVGAFMAIMIPTVFNTNVPVQNAFTNIMAYQYFLYHVMLIVLGVYILMSKEVKIEKKHFVSSFIMLFVFSFISLYVNSIFADATYVDCSVKYVDYVANFFFTYETPINIYFTEIWHWYLYYVILFCVATLFLFLFFLPFFRKNKNIENFKK